MGFLRFLFFAILGYYLLKLLGRLLAPILAKYVVRKSHEIFDRTYSHSQGFDSRQNVGDVTIEKKKSAKPKSSKPVGDYISFEEIE